MPIRPFPPLGQAGPRRRKREGAEEAEPAFSWWPALFRPHRRRPSFCTCTPSSPSLFLCFSSLSPANNTSPTEGTQTDALAVQNPTADTTTTAHFRVLPAASICRHCHASLFRASLFSLVLDSLFFGPHFLDVHSTLLDFVCLDCLSTPADSLLHSSTDERILRIDFFRPIYDAEHARVGSDFCLDRYRFGQPPLFSHHHLTVSLFLLCLLVRYPSKDIAPAIFASPIPYSPLPETSRPVRSLTRF